MLALRRNPILFREWRIATRPGKLWATLMVVFGLLTLAFVYLVLQERHRAGMLMEEPFAWADIFRRFAMIVLSVQIFTAFYICFGFALDCVVKERQSNTHEFLVSLPIATTDKVVGLCLGVNLLPLLLLVLMTPLGVYFGLAGGLEGRKLAWLYGLMAAGFVAVALMGVAGSSGMGKRRGAWLMVLLLLLLGGPTSQIITVSEFTAVPLMAVSPFSILGASVADPDELAWLFQHGGYHFYSAEVPWQLCPLVFYLFLAAVCFVTAVRRLSRPSAPPLPRWVTTIAFAIFHCLLIGFLADALAGLGWGDHIPAAGAYLVSFFVLILLWGWFTTAGYAAQMQWVERKSNWPARLLTEAFTDVRTPLFVSGAVLWAITVGGLLCVNAMYWETISSLRLLLAGAILLLFLLAYQAVYLLGCLASRRGGGPIGALLLALVVGIPLAFASIEPLEPLVNATPVGLFVEGNLMSGSFVDEAVSFGWPAVQSIGWGLGLAVVFFALCAWRFSALLRISPLGRRVGSRAPAV